MKTISFNLLLQRVKTFFEALPRVIFISWLSFIKIALLLIGFIVAVAVVAVSLFVQPSEKFIATSSLPQLDTGAIDTLELWLEQHEVQHNRLLQIPPNVFHKPAPNP